MGDDLVPIGVVDGVRAKMRRQPEWRGVRRVNAEPLILVRRAFFTRTGSPLRSKTLSRKKHQPACKPGSGGHRLACARAIRDGHSSGTMFAHRLEQPTRTASLT